MRRWVHAVMEKLTFLGKNGTLQYSANSKGHNFAQVLSISLLIIIVIILICRWLFSFVFPFRFCQKIQWDWKKVFELDFAMESHSFDESRIENHAFEDIHDDNL